jgi:stage V sporulation protein SpoVS
VVDVQQLAQQPQQQVLQQAAAVQPEQALPPQLQQSKQLAQQSGSKRSKKAKARAAAAAAAAAAPQVNDVLQEPQQEPQKPARSHRRMHTQAPLKFKPCGRGGSLKHAAAVSKHLSQGKQVLLPAGSGMQVARGVAALASARTLMLGYGSSTGLALQPSFPAAAAAAATSPTQEQPRTQVQIEQLDQQQQGGRQQDGKSSSSADSGIMMFVTGLPEAQLRRFEQSPLIAARYGNPSLLAGAAFARVCQQGFTAVRAAGPDAAAVALAAATQARRKLLGCGLDLAVVPMTEFVDIDSLTGPDGQPLVDVESDEQQQIEYGPADEYGRQCVRVTVLHLMRCEPQQPWQLLPWPPAPEQQPAVLWQAEQLEMQQRAWLQQQQSAAVQQPQRRKLAGGDSTRQQQMSGAVQQAAKAGGSAAAAGAAAVMPVLTGLAVPASSAQASTLDSSNASSAWPANSANDAAVTTEADELVLQGGAYSHAQGMVARQGASVLLQKQRKSKRQLVAAAQSAAHASKGNCSSGNGSAAS